MHLIYLNVAGFNIKISLEHGEQPAFIEDIFLTKLLDYYSGFVLRKKPAKIDFQIRVQLQNTLKAYLTAKDKDFYLNIFTQESPTSIGTFYSVSEEQFYLVIRTACQHLLSKNNGFFMHGSAVNILNQANLFLGDSGAGKSTIMKILSAKHQPLADDSFIIKKNDRIYNFYSSAAQEKNAWFAKKGSKYPVGNIFFLKKAQNHIVKKITDKERVLERLFNNFFSDYKQLKYQTKSLMDFTNSFNNFYELMFSLGHKKKLFELLTNLNEPKK